MKVLVDENLSEHLAEGLNSLQYPLDNGIHVTSVAKEFEKGIKDEDWIPKWGKKDGIFITQDIKIHLTRNQRRLLEDNGLGAFFLKVPNKTNYWKRVEILVKYWEEILDKIRTQKKPYSYEVTPKKGVKKM